MGMVPEADYGGFSKDIGNVMYVLIYGPVFLCNPPHILPGGYSLSHTLQILGPDI